LKNKVKSRKVRKKKGKYDVIMISILIQREAVNILWFAFYVDTYFLIVIGAC